MSLTKDGVPSLQEVCVGVFASVQADDPESRQRRFEQIIGKSPALKTVLDQVEQVAPADSTVLIQAETGTGEELMAHAVHVSQRCGRPFIIMKF